MTRFARIPLALALVLVLAGGATFLGAGDEDGERSTVKLKVKTDAGADSVEIEDLEELAVGESRSLTSASGKKVTVTREEEGYVVDIDGKLLRIGSGDELDLAPGRRHQRMKWIAIDGDGQEKIVLFTEPDDRRVFVRRLGEDDEILHVEPGHRLHKMKKIEIDGDGATKLIVSGDPETHRMILRQAEDGEGGFAFIAGDPAQPFFFAGPGLLDRIEKSEKFLALDETTRETVRQIVREAAEPMRWLERGDGANAEQVEIHIERRKKKAADEDD